MKILFYALSVFCLIATVCSIIMVFTPGKETMGLVFMFMNLGGVIVWALNARQIQK